MEDHGLGSWERAHQNGALAVVLEVLWTQSSDTYAFGVKGMGAVPRTWAAPSASPTRRRLPTVNPGVHSPAAAVHGVHAIGLSVQR